MDNKLLERAVIALETIAEALIEQGGVVNTGKPSKPSKTTTPKASKHSLLTYVDDKMLFIALKELFQAKKTIGRNKVSSMEIGTYLRAKFSSIPSSPIKFDRYLLKHTAELGIEKIGKSWVVS